ARRRHGGPGRCDRRPAGDARPAGRHPALRAGRVGGAGVLARNGEHGEHDLRGVLRRPLCRAGAAGHPADRVCRCRARPRAGLLRPPARALGGGPRPPSLRAAECGPRLCLPPPPPGTRPPPAGRGDPGLRARCRRVGGRPGQAPGAPARRGRPPLLRRSARCRHRPGPALPSRHRPLARPPGSRRPEKGDRTMTDAFEDRLRAHLAGKAAAVQADPDPGAFVERSAGPTGRRGPLAIGAVALGVVIAGVGVVAGAALAGGSSARTQQAAAPSTTAPGRAGAALAPASVGGTNLPAIAVPASYAYLYPHTPASGTTIRAYTVAAVTGPCVQGSDCTPVGTLPTP